MSILHEINFDALGTDISVKVVFEGENNFDHVSLEEEIKQFYLEKEKIFSRFDAESELSFLNNNIGKFMDVSAEMIFVAKKCLEYFKESQGIFDPRIIGILEGIGYRKDFKKNYPGLSNLEFSEETVFQRKLADDLKIENEKIFLGARMDFSGIAKGYITDKVGEFLRKKGLKNFLVNSGGDIRVSGHDQDGDNWTVAVEGILEDSLVINLDEENYGVATSGVGRRKWEIAGVRFHHLIDPRNPRKFNFDLRSVTVVDTSAEKADFWAKILFLMGEKECLEFSESMKIKSQFINRLGNAKISAEMKKISI
jgi:thiamine biosynthesis lipoprotein